MTYRSRPFREHHTEALPLILVEAIMLRGFQPYRSDSQVMDEAYSTCDEIYQAYENGLISEQEDMRLIVMLWAGQATIQAWETLESKLPSRVSAGLALVGGRSLMMSAAEASSEREKESHLEQAQIMLETARDHSGATESFQRLARTFLQELQP
jgi:hypothetical protein